MSHIKERGHKWQIFKIADNKIKLKVADIIWPKMADIIWPEMADFIIWRPKFYRPLSHGLQRHRPYLANLRPILQEKHQFLFKVDSSARITVSNHKVADHHLSNAAVTDTIFL